MWKQEERRRKNMQTTRKILVKRKKMTKSDKGGFEFKISINTYIDNT